MNDPVRIGTCGFRTTKEKYAELFSTVEIQHTFYQPPQIKTLERWRAEVPDQFEFAVKAWQLITHEAKSPTYKRLKKKLTEKELTQAGRFQPTAIVREAWETTLACAKALKITVTPEKCYYRLHGRTGWRYKYELDELEELAALLPKNKVSYIFFNNIQMTEDASVFQEIIKANK